MTQDATQGDCKSFSAAHFPQVRARAHKIDDLDDWATDLAGEGEEAPLNSSQKNKPDKYAFLTKKSPFSEKNDSNTAQHLTQHAECVKSHFAKEED